jgi:hypothetical protein
MTDKLDSCRRQNNHQDPHAATRPPHRWLDLTIPERLHKK